MASFSRSLLQDARIQLQRSSLVRGGNARSPLAGYRYASSHSAGSASAAQRVNSRRWGGLLTSAAVVGGTCLVLSIADTTGKLHLEAVPVEKRKSYAERMSMTERAKKEEKKGAKRTEQASSSSEKDAQKGETPASHPAQAKEGEEEGNGVSANSEEAEKLDLDELSEEASQQSAFDPETNTINWDCPCLGGMAHGPCGEQFKDAFSCFVFSEADPKGVDCVEKFQAMQDCFRKYPEHYKEELEDDEEFERSGQQETASGSEKRVNKGDEEEEDEGVREWRQEMEKEGKA